jgi:hypothetical protein
MPVRIIRFKKRPPGAEQVLAEIAAKLKELKPEPPLPRWIDGMATCWGCGRFGTFLCANCEELQSATQRRCEQLYTTLEGRFARLSLERILEP